MKFNAKAFSPDSRAGAALFLAVFYIVFTARPNTQSMRGSRNVAF
jgi:hypothetical protein